MSSTGVNNVLCRHKIKKTSYRKKYRIHYDEISNWDEIFSYWLKNGRSINAVYKKYKISPNTIKKGLKFAGYDLSFSKYKRFDKMPVYLKENILNDYINGMEISSICIRYGISKHLLQKIKVEFLTQGRGNRRVAGDDYKSLLEYSKKVRRLSATIRKMYGLETKNGFHWNHKLSIIDCYKNNIPLEVAAARYNLELIPREQNLSQGYKNKITPDQLYNMIRGNNEGSR
jgi:hypothetical protein